MSAENHAAVLHDPWDVSCRARLPIEPTREDARCPVCRPDVAEVRPWVKRLGAYLRIFGSARQDAGSKEHRYYIDSLTRMAQEREAEHGR